VGEERDVALYPLGPGDDPDLWHAGGSEPGGLGDERLCTVNEFGCGRSEYAFVIRPLEGVVPGNSRSESG